MVSNDLNYCFEILDGRHKLGYTFYKVSRGSWTSMKCLEQADRKDISLEEFLSPLFHPASRDEQTIHSLCVQYYNFADYIEPLVNRRWRLGIGKSLLETTVTSPMLAKHLDIDNIPESRSGYCVTEKLDGNRCIARYNYETATWEFISRSGKPMRVNFDMKEMPTRYVYDGEVLSRKQVHNPGQANFNSLSGAVNSKYKDKSDLVYIIFDIIDDQSNYATRRNYLDFIAIKRDALKGATNVQILPALCWCFDVSQLECAIAYWLEEITNAGGEGLMVNIGDRHYEQKRTNAILKVKKVLTIDMRVTELYPGTGKHEGLVGALNCVCKGDDGKVYECRVGTGLSDEQRARWANDPDEILGKIVEVAYFSISQDAQHRGTKQYSLRFPRLKRVRQDKEETSEY